MMPGRLHRFLGRLLVLMLVLGPLIARAQEAEATEESVDDRARVAFERGREHYDAGRFDQAEQEFQRAYRISGRIELLYNIYVTRRDAGRLEEAAAALREFVERRELPPDAPQARRLRALERIIAQRREAAANDARSSSPARSSTLGTRVDETLLFGGIGITTLGALALLSSVVTGVLALDDQAVLAAQCPDRTCSEELRPAFDRAGALVVATDALWIGGAAVAVVGAVMLGIALSSRARHEVSVACGGSGCLLSVRGDL